MSVRVVHTALSWLEVARDHARAAINVTLWAPVAMGFGIGLYFSLAMEPPLALGLVTVLVLLALHLWSGERAGRATGILMLFVAVGFLGGQIRTANVDAPILEQRIGPVTVEGRVLRWEEDQTGHGRLTLTELSIERLPADRTPERIRIVLRTGGDSFRPGDRVRLPVVLDGPPEPVFPGDYDYARRLFFDRIGALGFAVGPLERAGSAVVHDGWLTDVERLRTALSSRIRSILPGDAGSVADALITGSRQALTDEVVEAMRGSGLAHLLAISGLHLGLVTGFIFFTLRGLLALAPRIALYYPIKKWAAAGAIPVAAFYMVLSGAGVPTIRAFIMVSLVMTAVMLDRNPISLRLVAVAALVILALTPEALLSASFQMSFAAVTALVAAFAAYSDHRARRARRAMSGQEVGRAKGRLQKIAFYFLAIAATTIVSEVVLMAPTLYHFNRTSLYGLAGNLLAMPLVGFWIMPAAVIAMVMMPLGLDEVPFLIMGEGVDLMLVVARSFGNAPGAEALVPSFSTSAYTWIMAGFLVLCLLKGWGRALSAPLFLTGLVLAIMTPRPDILLGGDAEVMALRAPDGQYWFSPGLAGRHARRVASDWNAQWEKPHWSWDSATYGAGGPELQGWLRCDVRGCIYSPKAAGGAKIAVLNNPLAAIEDCRKARIILSFDNLGDACPGVDLLIHWPDIRENGGHAVYFGKPGEVNVTTVRQERGARPWVQ